MVLLLQKRTFYSIAGFELAGTVFMFANEGPDKYNIDFGHLQPENPRGGH